MRDKIKSIFKTRSKLEKSFMLESTILPESTPAPKSDTKVEVENGLDIDNVSNKLVQDFLVFVAKHFDLKEYPTIKLLATRTGSMTYGAFDPNTNQIMVYGKDRGLADILRTIAHELTHYWQKVQGRIPEDLKGRNSQLESEANTQAGDLIYMFGLEHPEVYTLDVKSAD